MAASPTVRVGLVQQQVSADRGHNLQRALDAIRSAASQGAQIVCTQELFVSHYFCQTHDPKYFEWAEPLDGPTASELRRTAAECRITILGSLFERRSPGLCHNTTLVIGPDGKDLGLYRKMHIPDDPQFEEKYYFAPGDTGFISVATPHGNVGPLVCWDQWYPEAARLCALSGAELLFYPTAIGWLPSEKQALGKKQLDAWQTIQRAHAIANGVFVIAVNRVGFEASTAGGIEFWGHSFVCDPSGTLLAEAGADEQVMVVDCDLSAVGRQRLDWPFLRDRRIDAYAGLTARFLGQS